jgi:hypothetical protein
MKLIIKLSAITVLVVLALAGCAPGGPGNSTGTQTTNSSAGDTNGVSGATNNMSAGTNQ